MKADLVKLLKSKNQYCKETDDQLINQIVFNLKLIEDSQADIAKRGVLVDISKTSEPYMQINFAISIYHNAIKSNNTLLKQLGLEKVKLESDPKQDAEQALQDLLK